MRTFFKTLVLFISVSCYSQTGVFQNIIVKDNIKKGSDTISNTSEIAIMIHDSIDGISGGVTPSDGIFEWNTIGNNYAPYGTQINGKFDTSGTFPTHTTYFLNLDRQLNTTSLWTKEIIFPDYSFYVNTTGDLYTQYLHLPKRTDITATDTGKIWRTNKSIKFNDDSSKTQVPVLAAYGELYNGTGSWNCPLSGVKTVTGFSGDYYKYSTTNDSLITITSGGDGNYIISYSGFAYTDNITNHLFIYLYVNDIQIAKTVCLINFSTINCRIPFSKQHIISLNTNDKIKIKIYSNGSVNNITVESISLTITRIGR